MAMVKLLKQQCVQRQDIMTKTFKNLVKELGGAYSYAYMDQHPVADLNAAKKKKKKEKVGEKFASDAQRKAAFASGYKAKGKKKK